MSGMFFATLLACAKDPVVKTIPAADGALEVQLFNPTSCSDCDPFAGVDTLVLSVLQDAQPISSATYAWPGAELSLPELDGFGVVQVELLGLRAGEVSSYGLTPEVALGPGRTVTVALQFLPANQALPLTANLTMARENPATVRLRNGRVLVVGGNAAGGDRVFTSIEAYDPTTGAFADTGIALPSPLTEAHVAEFPTGERLFLAGIGGLEGGRVGSTEIVRYMEEAGEIKSQSPLGVARDGACVSAFREGQALVLGGHDEPRSRGELVRRDPDDGTWHATDVYFTDLDDQQVTGCAPLADGRTFVQGSTAASTGIWALSEANEGVYEPETAFFPTPADDPGAGAAWVVGAAIAALADGDAWVGGGVVPATGALAGAARELRGATQRFDPADAQPAQPRAFGPLRIVDAAGTVAWGCGWRDLGRSVPLPSVELFNVETGAAGPLIDLYDTRDGCDLAVLPDGSILVVGGSEGATGEIIRPYWE